MEREIYKKDIERPGNSISFSVAIPQKFYGLSIDLDIEIPYLGYGFNRNGVDAVYEVDNRNGVAKLT
jgi:hypothetical protein